MRKLNIFICLLLLLTVPLHLVYPQDHLPKHSKIEIKEKIKAWDFYSLTYDDFLSFFDDLESGELEKICTDEDLKWIAEFLIFFAREGVLPGETEYKQILEEDIQELLHKLELDDLSLNHFDLYRVILCKGKVHRTWDAFKKFCKRNKKGVIIATAVVVAAVTVVGVVALTGAAGAAAAGTAFLDTDKKDKHKEKESVTSNEIILQPVLEEQLSIFKTNMAQEQFFFFF